MVAGLGVLLEVPELQEVQKFLGKFSVVHQNTLQEREQVHSEVICMLGTSDRFFHTPSWSPRGT